MKEIGKIEAAGVTAPTTPRKGEVIDRLRVSPTHPAASMGERGRASAVRGMPTKSANAGQAEAPCNLDGRGDEGGHLNPSAVDAGEALDGFLTFGEAAEGMLTKAQRRRAWVALKRTFARRGSDVGKPIKWR